MTARPVAIALGGNLGDVRAAFRTALAALAAEEGVRVVAVSPLYRTAPVGGVEQDDFLNAAALLAVGLEPLALLAVLQRLEAAAERVREERWGPRTLDLDVLWWDGVAIGEPGLVVPHPRLHERRFALQPLLDVVPRAADAAGRPYRTVLAALPAGGVEVVGGPGVVYDPTCIDR